MDAFLKQITFTMLSSSAYTFLLLAVATASGRLPDKYNAVRSSSHHDSQNSGFIACRAYRSKRENICNDQSSEHVLKMKRLTKVEMSELVQGMKYKQHLSCF